MWAMFIAFLTSENHKQTMMQLHDDNEATWCRYHKVSFSLNQEGYQVAKEVLVDIQFYSKYQL